jgi:hypothetical protein
MSKTRQLAVVSETELLDFEKVAVGTAQPRCSGKCAGASF